MPDMASAPPLSPARPGFGLALAAIVVAAAVSAAALFWTVRDPVFVAAFVAGSLAIGLPLAVFGAREGRRIEPVPTADVDLALLRAALDGAGDAVAVTRSDGGLLSCNIAWEGWFGDNGPFELAESEALREGAAVALREGSASVESDGFSAVIRAGGLARDHLVWRFNRRTGEDLTDLAQRLIHGDAGDRLALGGVMAALVDAEGRLLAANNALLIRALADPAKAEGRALIELIGVTDDGQFHFIREGKESGSLRLVQVPIGGESDPILFLLFDEVGGTVGDRSAQLNALLEILPLGLALADRDGRFVYLNSAFRRAAGVHRSANPSWPGDLVVDEDKGAVSDAVRRFGRGPSLSGDIAVRLKERPEEPVALTVAGARGLGEASVLLSLKDNSEEDRLKRQIAQATKMQAVGQLAGGVAHDFNNILTAIIGHCDLMLMRHTPGDSDYDDIQQIRSNSNRAASLTRQLLAFSRQQTLRPQVLQLPDVISEVSTLLKRLLGETVKLQVKHGRSLGAVRADPGQLEQVIINLAVNGRDAIEAKGDGVGTLTLQTYSVSAEEVRRMRSEILPIGDYTALRVSDTGTGIPRHLLAKIFEPFFTTKEVGKGTGLGLSTVYGIVKQSGGFIFAESEEGKGTSFVVYLPVHRAEAVKPARKERAATGELWGSGTILLVEDEATVRAVAEQALVRHGYTVLTAENGEAALEILAREAHIDLMISDVVMPTMDGPTTAREARKAHPDLPILFISGYAEEQLRQSIDLEKMAFLAKPFTVQKLAEAARDALSGK
jgi:two-component system cell cycle sensor histidine kinase/response regulator CckA